MQKQAILQIQNVLQPHQALLVRSGSNRFYLTGFASSAGQVLVTKTKALFLIDFRYFEKAKSTVTSCTVRLSQRGTEDLRQALAEEGVTELFTETRELSLAGHLALTKALAPVTLHTEDTMDRLLESLRSVKSREELALIRQAQALTDETFAYICQHIAPGRTEREIMLDMEFYMRRRGSEGVSFDFIVVSGKNSSLPHGVPTEKPVEAGDFVTMDFGACIGGYRSDMTRTVAVGTVTEEQKQVYETVLKAQLAALAGIRAGVSGTAVDKIARDLIAAAGYDGCFGHGLGHSVGIDIHENPNFNTRWADPIPAGAIMTVEPGIYLENRFGVRIEDMVYVTPDGCENLTHSPKNLICL